jgi:hypothetical protein
MGLYLNITLKSEIDIGAPPKIITTFVATDDENVL